MPNLQTEENGLKVTEVKERGGNILISFEDGHCAEFEPYTHMFGCQTEGLRHFFLYNGDKLVCQYDGRLHYCGPQKDEDRIASIAKGYSPEIVAKYWRAASQYVREEYLEKPRLEGRDSPEQLWYPWIVTINGNSSLERLEKG